MLYVLIIFEIWKFLSNKGLPFSIVWIFFKSFQQHQYLEKWNVIGNLFTIDHSILTSLVLSNRLILEQCHSWYMTIYIIFFNDFSHGKLNLFLQKLLGETIKYISLVLCAFLWQNTILDCKRKFVCFHCLFTISFVLKKICLW